jgi:hypothetical protein
LVSSWKYLFSLLSKELTLKSEKCVLAAALMAVILDDLKYGREPSEQ